MNPNNIRFGWWLALFACLLAISMATHVRPAIGASAAADPTFTDAMVLRYITNAPATQLTNPTASTTFDTLWSFPANSPNITAGCGFLVRASGNVTTGVGTNLSLVLHVTNTERITATAFIPAALTNVGWSYEAQCTTRTGGTSGTFVGQSRMMVGTATGNTTVTVGGGITTSELPIDTTVANQIAVGAAFGTSNASNKIALHQLTIQTLR